MQLKNSRTMFKTMHDYVNRYTVPQVLRSKSEMVNVQIDKTCQGDTWTSCQTCPLQYDNLNIVKERVCS